VLRKDNRGELLLGDWAEDALVQKLGVAMWWWEEKWETKDEIIQNISAEQMVLVAGEAAARGADIVEHAQDPSGLHAVKVRTRVNKSKCCIDVIPPEEFVVSRDARSLEDAVLKAHRTGVMVGTLIGIGYDADTVNALPTYNDTFPDRTRKYAQDATYRGGRDTSADAMLRKVAVTRGILTCDYDGTGLKDWYFVAGGHEHAPKLLEIAPYNDQLGFADFCPEPMPHTIFGRCPADRLAAIQKVQTVLVRQMNDNLFLSNTPQREVVMDWIVKPDQLMNLAPGAPVLVKQPGAIREISIPFVADKALAAMQYYDGQAELTTGVGRATAGLDPGALANQSATAAVNQYSAMLGRIEMIARIWAQGGMRKLFRGVFRCLKAYQDFARIVQIEGQERTVDPRLWGELDDLDVNINTGLGTGTRERDFAMLGAIEAAQKEILEKLGPNPIVDFAKLVRTMQLKAEAAGIAYPENFFGDPGAWAGPPPPPPPAPPRPSPDTLILADVEHAKIAAKARGDAEDLAFKRAQAIAKIASDERIAREKTYWDTVLEAEKLGIDRNKVMVEAAKVDSAAIAREFPA
ncbi:MAG: hypothetical protein IT566_00035, partial [Rhodospirillaceae bacterium]|nr:hypothetical protein [Rhodospirillaceae bacterium]